MLTMHTEMLAMQGGHEMLTIRVATEMLTMQGGC